MVFNSLKNVIMFSHSDKNLGFLQGIFLANLLREMYYIKCAEEAPDLWGDYSTSVPQFKHLVAEEAPDLWGDYSALLHIRTI